MFESAYNYKKWADERTVRAIYKVDANSYAKALAFLHQQLNHMTIVEDLFRARLLEAAEPHATTNTAELPELTELVDRKIESNDWYLRYIAQQSAADLEARVLFSFTAGNSGDMSRCEVLLHVLNHGTYHRGAISHALDLAGIAHPVDGYAKYLQDQKQGT